MASLMNYQAPSEAQPPQQPPERGSAPSKATTMAQPEEDTDDVRKCGYLKKQKHGHKRFFVLRDQSHLGPHRLEYYDNEKKFRNSLRSAHPSPPKKLIPLWKCFTVSRRADAKHKYLIALYTKDEYFAVVAENEQEQESWYQALSDLVSESKREFEADELQEGDGALKPGTVFREVWQVNLKPKGLGSIKGLSGIYRLCLSSRMVHLIRPNSDVPTIFMLLMNIRRCGHSENYFFMDVGRSCNVGSGELWVQVDDSVVAQSVHEGFLETMRLYRASFAELRPRSKSQSGVISFITTRRHLGNLPPSQTGLHRRSRTESAAGTPPTAKSTYRFRTSSEGEGTMIKPFRSVTGSLLHLNTARMNLGRQEGTGRYVRAPFNSSHHARSASMPVSHFPPATSPVSVCSSSGHGSASDTITRPSSSSVCGSPSDGGFISSDEYGSSPGDLRYFKVRSSTPDSLGNTPPIREESALSEYMTMDKSQSDQAGRDDNMEADKLHRKRTHSLTKPTITMVHQRTQTTSSLDEDSTENRGQILSSESAILKSSPDCNDAEFDSMCNQSENKSTDGGYMPMMHGVAASLTNSDAYMPMTPKSIGAPKQILNSWSPSPADTKGYMLMFPNAGSSPLKSQLTGFFSKSSEKVMNGAYMDMAPGNSASQKQSADSNCMHTNSFAKSFSSYFSLPRSFKSASKKNSEHNEYIPMSSPGKFLHKGVENDNKQEQNTKATRPTRLPLDIKGSSILGIFNRTILPEPTSIGEYINIDFSEKANNTPYSLSAEGSPSSLGSSCGHRQSPLSDYMSVDLDLQSPKTELPSSLTDLSTYAGSSISRNQPNPDYAMLPCGTACVGTVSSRNDDYTQMTFNMAMTPPRSFDTESSHGPVVDSPPSIVNRLSIGDRYLGNNSCSAEPPVGPKVIRADPQGRRRHSSETFSSSGTITTSSSIFTESSKRHSSASFDNVWPKPDESTCDNQEEGSMARNFSPGFRNGVNYISLNVHDTAKLESNCHPLQNATRGLDSGTYVSLDFPCSDGLECTSTRKE